MRAAGAWIGVLGLAVTVPAGCGPGPAASEAAFPAALAAPGPIALGRDMLLPLPDGATAFTAIRALLAGAHAQIDLEMYEFQRPDLEALLVSAHRRQVTVTAIIDPSERQSQAAWADLQASGIRVLAFPLEARSIDHVKLLIVDHHRAIVGGINWGRHSEANRDYDVLVEGPAVTNLERVFDQDRTLAGDPVVLTPAAPDPSIRVVATRPATEIRDAVLAAVASARRTIDVEMYVLSDGLVIDALVQAAARGVHVRVLLDPEQGQNLEAVSVLTAASIQARLYHAPAHTKLHAKLGIFDRAVVVFGSCNWSRSGFTRNHELDLVIQEARLASVFEARVDQDWAT